MLKSIILVLLCLCLGIAPSESAFAGEKANARSHEEDFEEPSEEGELSDSDLPPGEEYVDPSMVHKNTGKARPRISAIQESELGASDSDFVSLEEHAIQIREFCRHNIKDPQCTEYKGSLHERPRGLKEVCRDDPFNARCRKARDKKFDRILKAETICNKRDDKKKQMRCMMLQRKIYDSPDY